MMKTKSKTSEQGEQYGKLIARRHPAYDSTLAHWRFLEETYTGGRKWFEDNLFQYMKEGEKEFADRKGRAYRFNHTREVVDLLVKYLFRQPVTRSDEAPDAVKAFWKRATNAGMSIDEFMQQAAKLNSISGRIAIVIDTPRVADGEAPVSVAEAKRLGLRTYAYTVGPRQILDYSFDKFGHLNWILLEEVGRDDEDPFDSTGKEVLRYRLWDRKGWALFEEQKTQGLSKQRKAVLIERGTHDLGIVPVVLADHIVSNDGVYTAPSLIDDIAYLDRAVANYLSNLDAIIQDQTFSQLAMPAQNVLPGEDAYQKLLEMGTKRVFLYDGEGGSQPFFLSPDPKQAQIIVDVIHKIINEIYHTVGMAGERTKQDNSMGIDNSSGVAKAYDFERVNALLVAKAHSLEVTEQRIAEIVAAWAGEKIDEEVITYPDNFDTRGLYDEFDIAARLALITAPETVRREQMGQVVEKLFPQLSKDLKTKIETELKSWPPEPVIDQPGSTGSTGSKAPAAGGKAANGSRQGQVTKNTK